MPDETEYVRPPEFDVYATPDDYENYEKIKQLIVKELTETEELTEDMFDSFFEALKDEVRERIII